MAPSPTPPSADDVMELLRGVIDPELGSDIVELGMARSAKVDDAGVIQLEIALTTSGCPLRAQIQKDIRSRLETLPGVTRVKINWGELTQDEKSAAMAKARFNVSQDAPDTAVPPTTKVIMIASGKGGVGKSSVATNLAAALAERGHAVGVMDADIWGFSVPRMLGVDGALVASEGKITPLVREVGEGRLEVVSMGFLVEEEDSALMWRGLMLNRAVQHFCEDVAWSDDLDYLLIDMPPGTGDVQMGLAKMLPRAEMVIVTTPAANAQKVAARVADMGRKNYLRIVGVIENMSEFTAPDGSRHALFGAGGGRQLADAVGVPLLGSIPIEPAVSAGGDAGQPAVLGTGPAAEAFRAIAEAIAEEYVPPVEMAGCSARMLDAAMAALDALDDDEAMDAADAPDADQAMDAADSA
ncbi:MAG: P-loop NTPase [Actinobacteria bacterium]|nr:P-loop NTPase [Actinomycetota bacterium]